MAHRDFKISQQAVIKNSKNEVLILRNKDGDWLLPGGRVEENEDVFDTLKRELHEEIGLLVEVKEPIATDISGSGKTFAIAYNVEIEGEVPQNPTISNEHTEFMWAQPSELINLLHYKRIVRAIHKILEH